VEAESIRGEADSFLVTSEARIVFVHAKSSVRRWPSLSTAQIFHPLLLLCLASALLCFALALLKSAGHDGPLLYPGPL
jgi:hypothetical protein